MVKTDAPVLRGGIPAESGVASPAALQSLIERMQRGDRDAAAEFVHRWGPLIRRRYRHKLGRAMRSLFDSEELLSTISRRLDLYVRNGRLQAADEGQLWALVFRIAENSLADKVRIFQRLRSVEGEDAPLAHELASRLQNADQRQPEGAEIELDRILTQLPAGGERQILSLWLSGLSLAAIAEEMELTPEAVRKRWQRIRESIRDRLVEEAA